MSSEVQINEGGAVWVKQRKETGSTCSAFPREAPAWKHSGIPHALILPVESGPGPGREGVLPQPHETSTGHPLVMAASHARTSGQTWIKPYKRLAALTYFICMENANGIRKSTPLKLGEFSR